MKLEWKKQGDDFLCRYVVSLSGEVTEDFEPLSLKSLESLLLQGYVPTDFNSQGSKHVVSTAVEFDFRNLARLNSVGVRALLSLLAIVPKEYAVVYRNCVSVFMEHLNILPDFLNRGRVESVLIDEHCPKGHPPQSRLLTVGKEIKKGTLADEALKNLPKAYCRQCVSELEFHEVPSIYFSFLERMK